MLMSADIHIDTHTEVMTVLSLPNMPIYMLYKEWGEERWRDGIKNKDGGRQGGMKTAQMRFQQL